MDTTARGIWLPAMLPPAISCDRMTVTTADNKVEVFNDPHLSYLFQEGFLRQTNGSWELNLLGETVTGIATLDLSADLLQQRNLEVWVSWEGVPELKAEIEAFAVKHGCDISVVEVPGIKTKLLAVVRAGGRVPDLVMVQSDYLPELQVMRVLQPVDNPVPVAPGLDRVLSGEWTLCDFERAGRMMQALGATPYCWNAYSAYWLVSFQFGFGKERLIERDAMITIFLRGDVGAILTGSYSIPSFEKLGIEFNIAPYPVNQDTGKPVAPVLDYKGFAITRKARNPAPARRLIQYLSSPGVQISFTSSLSKLAARADVWDELERSHEYLTPLRIGAERGIALAPGRTYELDKNTMWKLLRLVLSGQMKAQEALEQGQAVLDSQLAARGG